MGRVILRVMILIFFLIILLFLWEVYNFGLVIIEMKQYNSQIYVNGNGFVDIFQQRLYKVGNSGVVAGKDDLWCLQYFI